MIGAESAVPVRELHSEVSNKTRDRARGEIGGERNKGEVSLFWVLGYKGTVLETSEKIRFSGRRERKGVWRGINVNFERDEHVLVIGEEYGG
jgi:hypothetical protein